MSDDLITIQSDESRAVEAQNLADVLTQAEAMQELAARVIMISLRQTNPTDWVNQDGTPYLQGSGAEKIALLWGATINNVKHEKRPLDEHPGGYMYEYTGTITIAGKSMEAVGACSTRDKFFGRSGGAFKTVAEIDETNIMRKAFNNLTVNLIKRRLGLRNLSWEQLTAAGIKVEQIKGFTYNTGDQGGTTEASKSTGEMNANTKTDDALRLELTTWLNEMHPDDPDGCMDHLKAASGFERDGKRMEQSSPAQLRGKWLQSTHKKLGAEYAAWKKANP